MNLSSLSMPTGNLSGPQNIALAVVAGTVGGFTVAGPPGAVTGAVVGGAVAAISQGNLTVTEEIVAAGIAGAATGFMIAGPKGAILLGTAAAGTTFWLHLQPQEDPRGMHLCWSGQGPISYDSRLCKTEHFYVLNTQETTSYVTDRGTLTVHWRLHNGMSLQGKTKTTERLTSRFLKQGKTLQETALIGPLLKCLPPLDAPFARRDVFPQNPLYKCLLDFALPLDPRYISYQLHPTA
jgi:hypothetical protein